MYSVDRMWVFLDAKYCPGVAEGTYNSPQVAGTQDRVLGGTCAAIATESNICKHRWGNVYFEQGGRKQMSYMLDFCLEKKEWSIQGAGHCF